MADLRQTIDDIAQWTANDIANPFCKTESVDLIRDAIIDGIRAALGEPTGDDMVDAPRQIILYAETPGRTLQGLRKHLDCCGIEYSGWFPLWALQENGHLTKGAIAILVWNAMGAALLRELDAEPPKGAA